MNSYGKTLPVSYCYYFFLLLWRSLLHRKVNYTPPYTEVPLYSCILLYMCVVVVHTIDIRFSRMCCARGSFPIYLLRNLYAYMTYNRSHYIVYRYNKGHEWNKKWKLSSIYYRALSKLHNLYYGCFNGNIICLAREKRIVNVNSILI